MACFKRFVRRGSLNGGEPVNKRGGHIRQAHRRRYVAMAGLLAAFPALMSCGAEEGPRFPFKQTFQQSTVITALTCVTKINEGNLTALIQQNVFQLDIIMDDGSFMKRAQAQLPSRAMPQPHRTACLLPPNRARVIRRSGPSQNTDGL